MANEDRLLRDASRMQTLLLVAQGCRVIRTTAQTIPNNTPTAISFDTEIYDTDNCWSSANPTRLYAQHSGYYIAGGSVGGHVTPSSEFRWMISIELNGTIHLAANEHTAAVGIYLGFTGVATGMIWMDAGDYIEISVFQNSGASKNTAAASISEQYRCNGWLMRIA